MFTDTEIGLKIGYDRQLRATTNEAQAIIDDKNGTIVALQRQLAAERAKSEDLIVARGRYRNELIARRIASRQH